MTYFLQLSTNKPLLSGNIPLKYLTIQHYYSVVSHIYLNISNLSDYITNNISLIFDLLRTFIKKCIFFSFYLSSFSIDLPSFFFISNHSITDYIVSHNLYRTSDLISKNFNILRVVIYLL